MRVTFKVILLAIICTLFSVFTVVGQEESVDSIHRPVTIVKNFNKNFNKIETKVEKPDSVIMSQMNNLLSSIDSNMAFLVYTERIKAIDAEELRIRKHEVALPKAVLWTGLYFMWMFALFLGRESKSITNVSIYLMIISFTLAVYYWSNYLFY